MTNESEKAPSGAAEQSAEKPELRIDELEVRDAGKEAEDSLRGGLINRGDSQPTLILADTWTGLTQDQDKDLA
ncbi:MAG TPA: hypothetical protein VKA84_16950 [Gemmatimonadaceae bacterium]|nr:hypothetical protein [Gemmatimonadaceae bacterium]